MRPSSRRALAFGALIVLAVTALIGVGALRTTNDTVQRMNSELFVRDAHAFLAKYYCVQSTLQTIAPDGTQVYLDASGVDDLMFRFVLAMAAIGAVELTGPDPTIPTLSASDDAASTCGVEFSWRSG